MIVGFLAMTMGQLVEMFYIGRVGKLELAAITFSFPITMSLNALTRGIGIGASTLIAQSMGDGDRINTATTITHCYLLVILFTVSLALLGQVATEHLFSMLGATGEVLILASSYAQIWLIGFPMMGIAMVSNGLIRSFGNANFPGYIMTIAPIVQITVGPFLIFGLFGLPELGAADSARWNSSRCNKPDSTHVNGRGHLAIGWIRDYRCCRIWRGQPVRIRRGHGRHWHFNQRGSYGRPKLGGEKI
jgi:Na+-driven multidrug efflux pump